MFQAIYRCLKCGAERQYGAAPEITHRAQKYNPLINCHRCKDQTRHGYVRIERAKEQ